MERRKGRVSVAVATMGAIVTAMLCGAVPAVAQADPVAISTTPALQPGFDPLVTDYVTSCAGGSVTVTVTDTDGTSVSVAGQPAQTSSFQAPVTLSSGQRFTIVIGGASYNVRCLPADFPAYTTTLYPQNGTPRAAYYLVTPGNDYIAMFNNRGVPVWWYKNSDGNPIDANVLSGGFMSWDVEQTVYAFGLPNNVALEEHLLNGALLNTLHTVLAPTDFHEGMQLPNGNFLMTTFILNRYANLSSVGISGLQPVLDAGFQEISPTGRLLHHWDSNGRVQPVESAAWLNQLFPYPGVTGEVWDEFHINSVAADGANFLISLRHSNAIYLISGRTGSVMWKLGGTKTAQSLTILNDPDAAADFGGQHDARLLPNGDISLYDDGTNQNRPPRGLVFKIIPGLHVALLVQTISDSTGAITLPSPYTGGFRALPGGHYVADWVTPSPSSLVDEVAPTSPTTSVPVLRIAFTTPGFTYRAVPVMPGVFTDARLQAAMDQIYPPS
jgi:hypothetical protein